MATKKTKKTVKKPLKKAKSKKKVDKIQDGEYWRSRPLSDKQVDWNYKESNWVEGYTLSVDHEHRQQIIDALVTLRPFGGVLEMGCNTGPNLLRISQAYPENQMAGYDISALAIEEAKMNLPKAVLKVGSHTAIPFDEKFDIVLADATLLYVGPDEISKVMEEIDRVSKKAVILVERQAEGIDGEVVGHVWGRDYETLFRAHGYEVIKNEPIKWETSPNWKKYGRLYVFLKA